MYNTAPCTWSGSAPIPAGSLVQIQLLQATSAPAKGEESPHLHPGAEATCLRAAPELHGASWNCSRDNPSADRFLGTQQLTEQCAGVAKCRWAEDVHSSEERGRGSNNLDTQ